MQLCELNLTQREQEEIERLLHHDRFSKLALDQVWGLMDKVWDELGCDNQNPTEQSLSEFYRHPVWVLNGLFIEQHEMSMIHRQDISNWLFEHKVNHVLDYGGGFGTLARLIATQHSEINIDIYEPFPSKLAIFKTKEFSNIQFIETIVEQYQCLVCLDVLEHVPDPLTLFAQMIDKVQIGGYLIIANCFQPDIKCHLPSTFHLRHTFDWFARLMGLKVIGRCKKTHAIIYQKIASDSPDWQLIRKLEQFSRLMFPLNEVLSFQLKAIKWIVRSVLGQQRTDALKEYLRSAT